MSRYLCITYVKRPNGQMDEMMTVLKSLKTQDVQTASIILDFKKLEVVKGSFQNVLVPKEWDRVVEYYYQHYQATIDRLFAENGWEVVKEDQSEPQQEALIDDGGSVQSA